MAFMKIHLSVLFFIFNCLTINAAATEGWEVTIQRLITGKPLIVSPMLHLPMPRLPAPHPMSSNTTFLPLNSTLTRPLFFVYQNPENMRSATGEIVCSPFSSFKTSPDTFIWCLVSQKGIFGHIAMRIPPEGDTVAINLIATIEKVKGTFLPLEVVNQFINSAPFYEKRWSIRVYNGDFYNRKLLEEAGFTLIPPVSIFANYARPSNAEIDGKTQRVRFTYSGKEAQI